MDYARQMVGHIGKRYVLSSLLFEDYFSHMVPWRTPRYSMNARRRVKTMDITRSCLSLVQLLDIVRPHCLLIVSSSRLSIHTYFITFSYLISSIIFGWKGNYPYEDTRARIYLRTRIFTW